MALANFASSGGVDNAAVCQAIELGKIAQDQSTQVVGALIVKEFSFFRRSELPVTPGPAR